MTVTHYSITLDDIRRACGSFPYGWILIAPNIRVKVYSNGIVSGIEAASDSEQSKSHATDRREGRPS